MQVTLNYCLILECNVSNLPLTVSPKGGIKPFTNVFTSRFLILSDGSYGPIARAVPALNNLTHWHLINLKIEKAFIGWPE